MTPSARLQCAVDALSLIEENILKKGAAADALLRSFFRDRRYAGSGDRRAVSERVYQVLRQRGMCLWLCQQKGLEPNARHLMLAYGAQYDKSLLELFIGGLYGPPTLDVTEQAFVDDVLNDPPDDAPLWAQWNCTPFVADTLQERFKDQADALRSALNERAPIDLRVNTLTFDVADVARQLENEGILLEHLPSVTSGLRLLEQRYLENHPLFKSGAFELQDEGSQLAAKLCGAQPGQTVIDLCAGGGGKTLALAADMDDQGRLIAADINEKRLGRLEPRLKRAHVFCATTTLLSEDAAARAEDLQQWVGIADLVVVDAPCSGGGTWRRHPEARWRYQENDIKAFADIQDNLLDEAKTLVKVGGRIVFITCSLLPQEGEERAQKFLARNPDFKMQSYKAALDGQDDTSPLESESHIEECLLLTPHRNKTDGFFVAIFEHLGVIH